MNPIGRLRTDSIALQIDELTSQPSGKRENSNSGMLSQDVIERHIQDGSSIFNPFRSEEVYIPQPADKAAKLAEVEQANGTEQINVIENRRKELEDQIDELQRQIKQKQQELEEALDSGFTIPFVGVKIGGTDPEEIQKQLEELTAKMKALQEQALQMQEEIEALLQELQKRPPGEISDTFSTDIPQHVSVSDNDFFSPDISRDVSFSKEDSYSPDKSKSVSFSDYD